MIRWLRTHPNAVSLLLIVAVAAAGLWGVQHEAEVRRRELCETVNDQQAVLADLVDTVLAGDGGGLPLTALPEFHNLDPATQDYVLALEAASRGDDPNGLDDRLRRFADERLVPADCKRDDE